MDIKKGFLFGAALGLAFGLGCATAVTVVPPASAQSASAQHWEYLEIPHAWDEGQWTEEADRRGWELVAIYNAGGVGLTGMRQVYRRPAP